MGRFAIGISAFGFSSGFAVKVGNDDPGPQRMMAWKPGAGTASACGIFCEVVENFMARLHWVFQPTTSLFFVSERRLTELKCETRSY